MDSALIFFGFDSNKINSVQLNSDILRLTFAASIARYTLDSISVKVLN